MERPEFLSPEGEKAWTYLRRHLDRSRSFWLGFLLTEDVTAARVLRDRAGWNRRLRAQRFAAFTPESPQELAGLIDRLDAEAPEPPGCAWVEAIHVADPRWDEAWGQLLQALNHRRDSLRGRLGGLVLAAPRPTKAAAQRLSSDLWSVRDLVLDLPVGTVLAGGRTPVEAPAGAPAREPAGPRSVGGLSLGDEATDSAAADEAVALLALAPDRLATTDRQRVVAAVAAARDHGDDQLAGVLLLALAGGYVEERDGAGARDLVRQVLALHRIDPPTRLRALRLGRDLAMMVADTEEAARLAGEGLELSERLAEQAGTPEALRDLSISLNKVGGVRRARGDWPGAETAYTRSLELRERLAEPTGTPEALRDLSVSLDNVAEAHEARGDVAAATQLRKRATAVRARLDAAGEGDTP